MKRFKNILYFADGEQRIGNAFERAVNLARANNAQLCVFDVLPSTSSVAEIEQRLGLTLNDVLRGMRRDALAVLVEPYVEDASQLSIKVATGAAFVEVIREVISGGFDLVVKAARAPGGLSERLLGSTDMHLLRKCPCPVWVDRPSGKTAYRSILAAVDPESPEGQDCAAKVLTLAASMAARENAELTVVHAWHLYGESSLESGFAKIPKTELDDLLADTERKHREMLDQMMEKCGLADAGYTVHLVKELPASCIRQMCQQVSADLIVMGTVGRCGIPGFIIGNTAEEVLQTTQASILAVKPDAFVSPVTLS
ncbi:universal stress protein [Pontibacterium sp.]|uniref:universal stress protein n=1 Tax=Pontibacterium sp. TaxID=2036026 RepID=UPI003519C50E